MTGRHEVNPRRAKPRWGDNILLITLAMCAGFVGGFLGTVLARAW
jgi:hypothetical protein